MRCDGCASSAPALKTVICRADRERRGSLCVLCWEPLRDRVWIVPGPVPCFGTCSRCGEWASVNDLRDAKPGGRRSAPSGVCVGCATTVLLPEDY